MQGFYPLYPILLMKLEFLRQSSSIYCSNICISEANCWGENWADCWDSNSA